MNYEFDNMTPNEIGEYLWDNCREEYNGKYFMVNNERLYPMYEGGVIVGWEFD